MWTSSRTFSGKKKLDSRFNCKRNFFLFSSVEWNVKRPRKIFIFLFISLHQLLFSFFHHSFSFRFSCVLFATFHKHTALTQKKNFQNQTRFFNFVSLWRRSKNTRKNKVNKIAWFKFNKENKYIYYCFKQMSNVFSLCIYAHC